MAWFRKKPAPDNAGFDDTFMGIAYKQVWERKVLPDPGAQNYAWETLALPAFTPIGAGNLAVSMRPTPFAKVAPLFTTPGIVISGIPTMAGQIIGQPLINNIGVKVGGQV